jgi:DNA-binding beta-propeller fold protein YncE
MKEFKRCASRTITTIRVATLLFGVAATTALADSPHRIAITPIGSYASGQFDQGAAEIVAHDPSTQRIFSVNAQAATVDVLSIADPAAPTKVGTIDLASFGAVATSVAVKNGIIAVSVQNAVKTDPGSVVFFNQNLQFVSQVQVGSLPDMLTFTPNGRYVLVANEGEPNDEYSVDPEGSVSIIDLSKGVANLSQANVRTAEFTAFNGQTLDPNIRIFGPGASVAQDLEPEYIAISHDSKTAWVTCQENNAIAVVDINAARVTELIGLGAKDHSAVNAKADIYEFDPATMPVIGATAAGQQLFLGGFSGLHFEGIDPLTGRYKFITHTDRGPNAEPTGILRPFLLPDFTPEIVRFELDMSTGALSITQRIPLQRAPGQPLTGLPNTSLSLNANQPYNDEVPVDLLGNALPLDPLGTDLEGVVVDPADGSFWMADEYRPAIYHFNSSGVLIKRFVPIGTAAAAGQPVGTFGDEVLPAVLAQRRQNRGFEGIALDGGKVYVFVQSPLRNPASLANSALNAMRNIRVVEFNPATLATRQYLYVLDNSNLGPEPNTRADKIGDAVSLGGGEFIAIERDDDALPGDDPAVIEKKIYRFNLTGATDVSAMNGLIGSTGKTVDQLTVAELVANGIRPIEKILYADLNQAGYNRAQKVEGLAAIDPWTLAVINDNDFGVANITVNPDGSFILNYVPEKEQLGIIHVRHNGLDASDSDGKINIRPWPVKGLYMPDAIAAYKVGNETFLVTANEGDVREWGSFVESVRIGSSSVLLDPIKFPNPSVLKTNANLGRLNISTASGRNPATGFYEELYAFGARSFAIWNSSGQQVFDSGDDFEWITALTYPTNFNASNSNNTRDNRSDDKGPEPEAVAIGKAFGRDYAFIALERIGGVVVYDISDPGAPSFVTYSNRRDFSQPVTSLAAGDLGPEGLVFIKQEESPNGKPLLVVGNEISGTTTVFQIEKTQ